MVNFEDASFVGPAFLDKMTACGGDFSYTRFRSAYTFDESIFGERGVRFHHTAVRLTTGQCWPEGVKLAWWPGSDGWFYSEEMPSAVRPD